jgi:antitoxin ParD1/3/4
MGAIERITIDLPAGMAARLRARLAAGEFASESEAVIDALLALEAAPADDAGVDAWLRGPVAEAYDAVSDGRATLHTGEEARRRLGVD